MLGALVDKSLVVAAPGPGGAMRYRMLETIHEYASERLDEAGERAEIERRHLVHYRELARMTDPLLRGAEQRTALDTLRREYENIRTALRRAHAARDEQETLCLVLSLTWYWQMVDQRVEARQWLTNAAELGPDPFAAPLRPAGPIHQRCTDSPPPMADDVLVEARRQVGLLGLLNTDLPAEDWLSERESWFDSVAGVYRPGLPQTCRYPGLFWLLTLLFTGDEEGLARALDETVAACEEFGYEWELASVLRLRANMRANRGASAEAAVRDADRALVVFQRLGDVWSTAETLSARGEANERLGRFGAAVADFTQATVYAEGLGALHHMAVLRVRLAQNLMEVGRAEEGEAILHEVLSGSEGEDGSGHHEVPVARLFLAIWLGRTGRVAEARTQLRLARERFQSEAMLVFRGFVQDTEAWLDVEEGLYGQGRERIREALTFTTSPMARLVAPEMAAVQLLIGARCLAGLAPEGGAPARGAARLLGAYEGLVPAGHIRAPFEAELYETAQKEALTALGGDEPRLTELRAEGATLTREEAASLI
ncbi:hypothetical protein GCM10023082_61660 [Streptomyces tremellae]|uniref:MalT-like TPR region domain-containing protein n=1 Tax=Streptomyces tremellae TaxID=1124239 RepID=A0ABP7G9Q5_9ACTN